MKFVVITHVSHFREQNFYFAYSPYVKEMNIWAKFVDEIIIVAPLDKLEKDEIDSAYSHKNIDFREVSAFNFLSLKSTVSSLIKLPKVFLEIYKAMKTADHIHLRCPGNMGLLGCLVQILFPKKTKTAKYAGNWDFKAKQPFSYRLQKWILSNTFLTKNMRVLVYGDWENSTQNIKPFFTASYFEKEKAEVGIWDLTGKISFLFAGTLSPGKRPLYAMQLVEELYKKGYDVQLSVYGDGSERPKLEQYISYNGLENIVFLKGNQNQETLKKAYLENHFIVLPSRSEGWPKVLAEGMFWGCLPIASKVSCVPDMLGNGKRGLLLEMNLKSDAEQMEALIKNADLYQDKTEKAIQWSRQYTMDVFEEEIKKLLKS